MQMKTPNMARKKVALEWIANDRARKASLKKRRVGLLKKVKELSILCDVDASIIIYSPDEEQPMMWPSDRLEVQEMWERFHNIPEIKRNKKMMNQETYLEEMVYKVQEQIKKHQRKHKEMGISNIMHNVVDQDNGVDELGMSELHSLIWFVEEKRKKIKKMIEYRQRALLSPAENMVGNGSSSSRVKSEHMVGLSAHYHDQSFSASSSGRKQLGLVGPAYYKAYFGGSNGAETIMGLQVPNGDLKGLMSSGGSEIPLLFPPSPLRDSDNGNGFALGLQPQEGFKGLSSSESDMATRLPPPHFEGSGSGSDIALGLQPYGNVETNSSVSGGDHMGSNS